MAAAARTRLKAERLSLPVREVEGELLTRFSRCDTLVVSAETGSGKTTQIPQMLHSLGLSPVAVTQPRRVAATTVARRVSEEMGCEVGGLVGYSVRFDDLCTGDTFIKYLTDGMLLREAMLDPLMTGYRCVVLDEAHERTLHTDVLFGLVKEAQRRRREGGTERLKILVMSATLDVGLFSGYFGGAECVVVEGRQHPVEVWYAPKVEEDYVDAALCAVMQIHLEEPVGSGDVLVFLTGQDEIESMEKVLRERCKAAARSDDESIRERFVPLLVCPIFAALPSEQQMRAFDPAPQGTRKCILATNIAETSLTISGVRFVVDTGFVKSRGWNKSTGMEELRVVPVSRAQARQRAGRAGREAPGKCYRLYTEPTFHGLAEATVPEIKRANLSTVVLQLMAMGIEDVLGFDFVEPPPVESLKRALESLLLLGALDDSRKLTELGRQMAQFPLDPSYSKVLVTSVQLGCWDDALTVVSMISAEGVFVSDNSKSVARQAFDSRRRLQSTLGDHVTLLNVYREYSCIPRDSAERQRQWCVENAVHWRAMVKAQNVRDQLSRYRDQIDVTPAMEGVVDGEKEDAESMSALRKCFVAGFARNVAVLRSDKKYSTMLKGIVVHVHPTSVLHGAITKPSHVLFNELLQTNKPYMRCLLVVEPSWLPVMAPRLFAKRSTTASSTPSLSPSLSKATRSPFGRFAPH